ncbi:SCP2 sterol-binding domain-containing protein [Ferdinandcohnia sp. Marseille-Q9671]
MTKTIESYTLNDLMLKIEEIINQDSAPIAGLQVVYQFTIKDDEEVTYQLQLSEGKAKVVEGFNDSANCTLLLSLTNFRQFILGKLNGTAAFMTGKLKIKGDIGKAMKLEGLLKEYNLKDHL